MSGDGVCSQPLSPLSQLTIFSSSAYFPIYTSPLRLIQEAAANFLVNSAPSLFLVTDIVEILTHVHQQYLVLTFSHRDHYQGWWCSPDQWQGRSGGPGPGAWQRAWPVRPRAMSVSRRASFAAGIAAVRRQKKRRGDMGPRDIIEEAEGWLSSETSSSYCFLKY